MKKNLLSAITPFVGLLTLALSLNSCSKSSDADKVITDPPTATTSILYRKNVGDTDVNELWSVNANGTNDHKISIALPSGWSLIDEDMTEVSKDNKTMVVAAYNEVSTQYGIYKCNIDGSNVQPVLTTAANVDLAIQGYIDQSSILYWRYPDQSPDRELWRTNLDGTNNVKINITLPANSFFGDEELAKVTSDGKTIVFLIEDDSNNYTQSIYKCNIDGSNLTLVSAGEAGSSLAIQDLVNNVVIYRKSIDATFEDQLWAVGLDGTGKTQIKPTLPTGTYLQDEEMAKVSADGKTLYFSTTTEGPNDLSGTPAIYSAKIDGSAPTLVKQLAAGDDIAIQSLLVQ